MAPSSFSLYCYVIVYEVMLSIGPIGLYHGLYIGLYRYRYLGKLNVSRRCQRKSVSTSLINMTHDLFVLLLILSYLGQELEEARTLRMSFRPGQKRG